VEFIAAVWEQVDDLEMAVLALAKTSRREASRGSIGSCAINDSGKS
jgi:hypothetical protein